MKRNIGILLIATFGAVIGAGLIKSFDTEHYLTFQSPQTFSLAAHPDPNGLTTRSATDFVTASAVATPAVVHIKSFYEASPYDGKNPWLELFGQGEQLQIPEGQASGSGVIISADGFIVTNNHVVRKADKVEVVLNDKRSFKAEVVGTDPTTDLALLRIDEENLPHLRFGNSDQVQVGEWVLAVGNPFNLTSTVTAGIVSAKGRNLNLLNQEYSIESFIQTDAAVNPGNSGGALINTAGELIGINTAISSQTGSFAGYSFAVPANLVKKVMQDIKEYGQVQRGIIGVRIQSVTDELEKEKDLGTLDGAFIAGVIPGGAAESGGIKTGDVIVGINSTRIKSASELQEIVGTYRPGDKITVVLLRNKKETSVEVTLKGLDGTTDLVKKEIASRESTLGADLRALSSNELSQLKIDNGVKVESIDQGILRNIGISKGFIITQVNKKKVKSPEEVEREIETAEKRVVIEGLNPTGGKETYSFAF